MAFCTNCGAASGSLQGYCAVCGHQLSSLPAAPPLSAGEVMRGGGSARVVVGLAHKAPRQSRVKVLVRGFILVPLALWYFVLSIASFFMILAAWFSSLVLGRNPDGIQHFLTDVLRYQSKVSAYGALLTARWPGMNLAAQSRDQISLEIDHVRLNRAAVLFRLILAVPALVVSSLLGVGSSLMTFVMWCCAVVTGRVPQALHEARGLIWRYTTRTSAYVALLTPTQPFDGFFGDPAAETPSPPTALSTPGSPVLSTTWTLSTAARVLFILCLILGAYFQVQPSLLRWPTAQVIDRAAGRVFVDSMNATLVDDLSRYQAPGTTCVTPALSGGCDLDASSAARDVQVIVTSLRTFQPFAVRGRNEYGVHLADVERLELTLTQLANSPSPAQQELLARNYGAEDGELSSLFHALRQAI